MHKIQIRTYFLQFSSAVTTDMSWKKEILILIYAILFILKERWNLSQTPNPIETGSKKEQNGPQTRNENPLRYSNPKKENQLDKVPCFLARLIPALQGHSACERTACKWGGHRSKRTRHEWENEDAGQGHHPTQGGGDDGHAQVGGHTAFRCLGPCGIRQRGRMSSLTKWNCWIKSTLCTPGFWLI